jgi:hypothetical protein
MLSINLVVPNFAANDIQTPAEFKTSSLISPSNSTIESFLAKLTYYNSKLFVSIIF